jgi:hypothetical protein
LGNLLQYLQSPVEVEQYTCCYHRTANHYDYDCDTAAIDGSQYAQNTHCSRHWREYGSFPTTNYKSARYHTQAHSYTRRYWKVRDEG